MAYKITMKDIFVDLGKDSYNIIIVQIGVITRLPILSIRFGDKPRHRGLLFILQLTHIIFRGLIDANISLIMVNFFYI